MYEDPNQTLIQQAAKTYEAGDWNKTAATLKDTLKAAGPDRLAGEFYYDLGTTLARAGAMGEGYVALLRASFELPFDGDVRHHLQKVEMAVPISARAVRPALWFSFWPPALRPVSHWLWLLAGLLFSAAALWLLGSADKALPAGVGATAAALLLVAGLAFLQDRLPVSGVTAMAKVKSGPGATFTDITSLEPGSLVNEDGERDGWRKVRFKKGDSEETVGWVEPAGLLGVR